MKKSVVNNYKVHWLLSYRLTAVSETNTSPCVNNKTLVSLTYHQSGTWTLTRARWNQTIEFWNSPGFEMIDYGLTETILCAGWDFSRVSLKVDIVFQGLTHLKKASMRVNISKFPGFNPMGILFTLAWHCSLIITL